MSFIGRIRSMGRTAGLYEGLTEGIEKREEYIRDRIERARQRAETNFARVSQRKLRADTALTYANQLTDLGVPDDLVKAIVQSGPDAVKQAAEDLAEYTRERGISSISPEEARQYITVGADFAGTEKDLQELIMETYGANVQPATRVEGGRKGFLEQLFKFDTETAIDEEIGRPEYGQLSVSDINRLAEQPEYTGDPAAAAMVRLPEAQRDDTQQFINYNSEMDTAKRRVQDQVDAQDPSTPEGALNRKLIVDSAQRDAAKMFYDSPAISERLKRQIEETWRLQYQEEPTEIGGVEYMASVDEDGRLVYVKDMNGNYLIFNGKKVVPTLPWETPVPPPSLSGTSGPPPATPAEPAPAEPLTIPDYAAP